MHVGTHWRPWVWPVYSIPLIPSHPILPHPISFHSIPFHPILSWFFLHFVMCTALVLVKRDTNFEYHYNTSSKLLTSIKRTSDNGVITISYNKANHRPQKFTTSSGNSMTVKYDNTGKLKSTYLSVDDRIILR